MIKYVVFDFDGTLVDSKAVFISVFNQLAEKHQFNKMEPGNIEYLRQLTITERCKYLQLPLYKLPLLTVDLLNRYQQSLAEVILLAGIKNLIEALRNSGYAIAIVSSNSEKNIRQFLQQNQITEIDAVYSARNIFGKDRVIKKFLKTYRLSPDQIIYVGDEVRDIVACKKIGVKVIWVSWGYDIQALAEKETPDFTAHSPDDILIILKSVNPAENLFLHPETPFLA
ncbi:phosphoglycolate phosphatase [Adhaeribacter aerolatus]|uniref:Phosphoglycolate phosphatase n=1 Tax=Adhaeribacter aerolatus TaxID=670289 RepID=A0A512AVZ5_9BACT|nr:HAD-IA family hydrolase [Adhaeribacter aerolatus]GEO03884.1 phosphoglycolate phosphatase [Adhaeribacter aerolatus]